MKKHKGLPAEQRVVVLPMDQKDSKSAGGIILPAGMEEDVPGLGTVVLSGTGSKDNPMMYNTGDIIVYSQYAGLDVKLNLDEYGEHTYKVMNQLDIMMKLIPVG